MPTSLPTPNYVLTREIRYGKDYYSQKVLPPGLFARPIELQYVPKHVIESSENKRFDKNKEVYCYTREGIIPIPLDALRKV